MSALSMLEIEDYSWRCEMVTNVMHGVDKTFILEGSFDHDTDLSDLNIFVDTDRIICCKAMGRTDGAEIPHSSNSFFQIASPIVVILIGDLIIEKLTGVSKCKLV